MIYRIFLVLSSVLLFQNCTNQTEKKTTEQSLFDTILFVNFENNVNKTYSDEDLKHDWGTPNWSKLHGRAQITDDSSKGKVLRVSYPAGSVGPDEGGVQFDMPLPENDEYTLRYDFKFDESFEFVLGGKLPGLTSGGEKYTGGIHPTKGEGWSARYMWREEGDFMLYFYHMDMKEKWGDNIRADVQLVPNKWYTVKQYLRLNTLDNFDGVMQVWVDESLVIDDDNVRFRIAPKGMINSFYFSTFYGGNTRDWAPQKDNHIYFDNFLVMGKRINKNFE